MISDKLIIANLEELVRLKLKLASFLKYRNLSFEERFYISIVVSEPFPETLHA